MTSSTVVDGSAARLAGGRVIAPYITRWTGEHEPDVTVVQRRAGGIGYARETVFDRDQHGVLWSSYASRPGRGRPEFGKVNPLRQRRAMDRLLCQVCGGPADRDADGRVLWLWKDHRDHWPGWPNEMWSPEPPVCLPCVGLAVRLCPALRRGAVAVRVGECPVVGVRGLLYRPGPQGPVPVDVTDVGLGGLAARWVQADCLVRQLRDCSLVELDELR